MLKKYRESKSHLKEEIKTRCTDSWNVDILMKIIGNREIKILNFGSKEA